MSVLLDNYVGQMQDIISMVMQMEMEDEEQREQLLELLYKYRRDMEYNLEQTEANIALLNKSIEQLLAYIQSD